MKYLSILFVAAVTIVSCTSTEEAAEVKVCDCVKAEAEAKDAKAWAADEANAACVEAMKDEKAKAECSKDANKEGAKKEEPKKVEPKKEEPKKEEPKKEEPKKEEPAGNDPK